MKTDKNFKLSKTAKRMLSAITNKEQRLVFKRTMIDAEASLEALKKRQPKEKEQRVVPD